jgi:hypothetical protein
MKASKVQGLESNVVDKEEQYLQAIISVFAVDLDAKTLRRLDA